MTRKHKQESNRLVSSNLILQVNEQDTHWLDDDQNCQVLTNVEHEMNGIFEEDNTQQHDVEEYFNELFCKIWLFFI